MSNAIPLIPDTAPFTPEQRAWLNGFFAGLVSLDGAGVTALSAEQSAALKFRVIWSWTYLALRWVLPIG